MTKPTNTPAHKPKPSETTEAPVISEAVSVDDATAKAEEVIKATEEKLTPIRERAERTGTDDSENPEEKPSVESYPLEDESPEQQAKILHYVTLWKEADSQEKKDTYEGFLMMEGVDMSENDWENRPILIVPEEERGLLVFMGFIKVGMALAKRLLGNKTSLDKLTAEEGIAAPEAMPPAERFVEMQTNEEKLTEMTGTKEVIENALVSMKDDLKKATSEKEKGDLQTKIDVKEAELATITTEMTALEQRQTALQEADKASPMQLSEADRNALEKEKDPILRAFLARKISVREEIRSIDLGKKVDIEGYQRIIALFPDAAEANTEIDELLAKIHAAADSIVDAASMESDGKEKYRFTLDIPKIQSILEAAIHPTKVTWNDGKITELRESFFVHFTEKGFEPELAEGKIVTKWMRKEEAQTWLESHPST